MSNTGDRVSATCSITVSGTSHCRRRSFAAAAKSDADDDAEDSDDEDAEDGLTEAEIKALKKDLGTVKKQLALLQKQLVERLHAARARLDEPACRALALDLLRADLATQLDRYVSAHRQEIVDAVEVWWGKYHAALSEIDITRNEVETKLAVLIGELGYAG